MSKLQGKVALASDECFMSGANLQLNGGLLLRGNPPRDDFGAAVEQALAATASA